MSCEYFDRLSTGWEFPRQSGQKRIRPTPILFEAGNGDDGSVWKPVLDSLYNNTGATLITYDRAGLGKSELDSSNISFTQEVEDLEKALKRLGYEDDF